MMSYTYGVSPVEVRLGGTPVIQGFTVTTLECLVIKTGTSSSKTNMILGFKLGHLNFADLLMAVTKFNFGSVFPLLKQTVDATVTISPVSSTEVKFSIGELAAIPVNSGVTLTASMTFPKICENNDIFCAYAGILIGHDTILTLKAAFLSSTDFPIFASVINLDLGNSLSLENAGLEIVGGKSSRIGLVGAVQLQEPPLLFTAGISAGTKGLTLQLSVSNCWEEAFNVKWLTLCNFLGSVDFAPPTGITGFAFGAEIRLGYPDSGHQLMAQGYMGVSIINPLENYYYVSFTSITMGPLLKAFKVSFSLPKPLADSGFPEGFLSSFSAVAVNLEEVGVSIPAGYTIKGTLDILGLQGRADITIGLPNLIDINVGLPPIKVGSILTMYSSSSNSISGPQLKAKVQLLPSPNVNIEAQGYLNVLGISLEASLRITDTLYQYDISGKILNLFNAQMSIMSSYRNIKNAVFQVKGEFEADLRNNVKELTVNLLKDEGSKAENAYNQASSEVEKYLKLQKEAQSEVNKAKKILDDAINGVFIAKAMNSCSGGSCKKAILQGKY